MASYYKIIDGMRYDRQMLDIAEESAAGQGDGRISVDDAKKLCEAIIDGNTITQVEQDTLDYITENFNFTTAAENWLTQELITWTSRKKDGQKSSDSSVPTVTAEAVPIEVPKRANTDPVIWKVLAIVFIVLLPVVFFIGKNLTSVKEDPILITKVKELEASLLTSNQALVAEKAEAERLRDRIDKMEETPVEVQTKEDPILIIKVKELEASLLTSNQALVAEKAETERLRDRIDKMEETPVEVQTKEKPVLVEDKDSQIRKRVAATLEKQMSEEFSNPQIQFDPEKLQVSFIPVQPFFERGGVVLEPVLRDTLSRFFPKFIQTLKEHDQEISEIQFQGHSSSFWKNAKDHTDAYLNNMSLSIARAEEALNFCINLDEMEQHRDWLTDRLVIKGFSDNKPILGQDNQEDLMRSRRITIAVEVFNTEQNE